MKLKETRRLNNIILIKETNRLLTNGIPLVFKVHTKWVAVQNGIMRWL
jgi:hypothetical protein